MLQLFLSYSLRNATKNSEANQMVWQPIKVLSYILHLAHNTIIIDISKLNTITN